MTSFYQSSANHVSFLSFFNLRKILYLILHLDSVSVSNGAVVNAGTIIGKMGTTGQSTGVHLHFDVWDKEAGIYVDPLLFY